MHAVSLFHVLYVYKIAEFAEYSIAVYFGKAKKSGRLLLIYSIFIESKMDLIDFQEAKL